MVIHWEVFISGIIILLDKSLTVGDYVELEDGQKGIVREFKMRYAVLETYDGKDVLVPNEKFISSLLINWTHKNQKQRYRIDFSVAYKTDIRAMVEIIKEAVSEHPQVISGCFMNEGAVGGTCSDASNTI